MRIWVTVIISESVADSTPKGCTAARRQRSKKNSKVSVGAVCLKYVSSYAQLSIAQTECIQALPYIKHKISQ
jgi:hypothetical protein